MMMIIANTHSTLLSALKTNRPIPKPKGTVIPGARNLSQASIKLMAQTNPIQRKIAITAIYIFSVIKAMGLMSSHCNAQFWQETFQPFVDLAI